MTMMRYGLSACLLLFSASSIAQDAGRSDVTIHAVMLGDSISPNSHAGSDTGAMAVTIYMSGIKSRIDFDDGQHLRGKVLRDGDKAWLVPANQPVAIPDNGLRFGKVSRLDPKQPCWNLGFACQRDPQRKTIAGASVTGWRYDDANHAGPDGTDRGELWLDEHGIVLGFDAQDSAGRDHRMQATTVSFEPLAASVFAFPGAAH